MADKKDRRSDLDKVHGDREVEKRDRGFGQDSANNVSFDKPVPPEKDKKE